MASCTRSDKATRKLEDENAMAFCVDLRAFPDIAEIHKGAVVGMPILGFWSLVKSQCIGCNFVKFTYIECT
jgi:hypothetical protein